MQAFIGPARGEQGRFFRRGSPRAASRSCCSACPKASAATGSAPAPRTTPPTCCSGVEQDEREAMTALLPANAQNEIKALLAYAEDEAGGLMNPRFARPRPDMTIDQAIAYLRRQARTQARDDLLRLRARRRPKADRRGLLPLPLRAARRPADLGGDGARSDHHRGHPRPGVGDRG